MTSPYVRGRDFGRKQASGAAKRKAKEAREQSAEEVISKSRKLTSFFDIKASHQGTSERPDPDHVEATVIDIASSSTYTAHHEPDQVQQGDDNTSTCTSEAVQVPPDSLTPDIDHVELMNEPLPTDGGSTSPSVPIDIGEWLAIINTVQQDEVLAKGSALFQNSDADFSETGRVFPGETAKRYCQSSFFSYKHRMTGKKYNRLWLCFSVKK